MDVIVGSDVLVFPTTIPSLVHVLSVLLLSHGVCYVASSTEPAVSIFLALMADAGRFSVSRKFKVITLIQNFAVIDSKSFAFVS